MHDSKQATSAKSTGFVAVHCYVTRSEFVSTWVHDVVENRLWVHVVAP